MKKLTTLLLLAFSVTSFAQEISVCEQELNSGAAKPLPVDKVWYGGGNSFEHGMIRNKVIEYAIKGQPYSETYKLYKYEKYGYYAVQSEYPVAGERSFFYNNLTDAVRALFTWQRCRIVLQKGKVMLGDPNLPKEKTEKELLNEAAYYTKIQDIASLKKTTNLILEKNPNHPDLLYNLGVLTSKTNIAEAEIYYKKTIAIDPNYFNAYLNLSALILMEEKAIIDQMEKLGTSALDNKNYNILKEKRKDIHKRVLVYLEKAHELNTTDESLKMTLYGIYQYLEMTEQKNNMQLKIKN